MVSLSSAHFTLQILKRCQCKTRMSKVRAAPVCVCVCVCVAKVKKTGTDNWSQRSCHELWFMSNLFQPKLPPPNLGACGKLLWLKICHRVQTAASEVDAVCRCRLAPPKVTVGTETESLSQPSEHFIPTGSTRTGRQRAGWRRNWRREAPATQAASPNLQVSPGRREVYHENCSHVIITLDFFVCTFQCDVAAQPKTYN